MQIADKYAKGAFPPAGGGAPDITDQLQQQRAYHRRILWQRTLGLWWYRILLIIVAVLVGTIGGLVIANISQAYMGQAALTIVKISAGGFVGLILFFLAVRRLEFGLLLLTIFATAFLPQLFTVKSLSIFPATPLLFFLFFVLLIQAAFHLRKFVFPSFWAIWPQLALIIVAIISTIMVQLTWTAGVPHKLNSNPILYDELFGIGLCFIPLIAIMVTTMAISEKGRYVEYIQRTFLILAFLAAAIVVIEFKRIGATVYTFRYSEPTILWMKLKDLAQLINLGAMIAYVRLLYATRWRTRGFYAAILVMCLVGVYFTLENSWWLEIGVALLVITIVYSRRLILWCCIAALPAIPLIKAELAKIATVKTADYYRLIIWQDALRVWSKQPILGVGPGDFWAYDQHFTQLPRVVRNCTTTGLCVAHNGYLQVLAEMGVVGLFVWLAIIVGIAYIAAKLIRRSKVPKQKSARFVDLLGLNLSVESDKRDDHMLGMIGLGLICGSAVADFFSGGFILPARQIDSFQWIPHVLTSWIIFGCVIYRDQIWRMARKGLKISG